MQAENARGMSEYKLAEQAQVTRSTIRAWLGKK
nr:MAG TPA: Regulatory protein [Caudoviricetes sp.]